VGGGGGGGGRAGGSDEVLGGVQAAHGSQWGRRAA
jgi:hypothetical protein